MNEIEKLYENAGIEKKKEYGCTDTWEICHHQKEYPNCKGCPFWKLIDIKDPPFTEKKQLELVKWIAHKAHNGLLINIHITNGGASMVFDDLGYESTLASSSISFEECIAKLVNNLWQDLTEEEKEQIRSVLK